MMNLSEKDLDYVQLGGRYPRLAYGDPGRTAVGSRPAPVLDAKPSVCGLPNNVTPPPLLPTPSLSPCICTIVGVTTVGDRS